MAQLSLRHLTKQYRQTLALDDVSLEVKDGEFLVLLGPSGSGKSTILKLIAGIEAPDRGEIWLGEERIEKLLPRFRDVAMVFQSYALYPNMTVSKNLAFPLESAGVKREERRWRVQEVAQMLGLELLLKRKPSQLSGGQQQRVALGRAIVRRPRLFLLDEPLSNLDAQLRARTRLDLVALHERLGVTTIYVTHDQTEAMTMGQRVAVIDGGHLHQVDTPEVVYEHPADLTVARFLGSPPMNLIPVEIEPSAGASRVRSGALLFEFPSLLRCARGIPGPVILGIRAEYLLLEEVSDRPTIVGQVSRVELLGHERLVYLQVGEHALTAWASRAWPGRVGETVNIGIDVSGLRLFDAHTGQTLQSPLEQTAPLLSPII